MWAFTCSLFFQSRKHTADSFTQLRSSQCCIEVHLKKRFAKRDKCYLVQFKSYTDAGEFYPEFHWYGKHLHIFRLPQASAWYSHLVVGCFFPFAPAILVNHATLSCMNPEPLQRLTNWQRRARASLRWDREDELKASEEGTARHPQLFELDSELQD